MKYTLTVKEICEMALPYIKENTNRKLLDMEFIDKNEIAFWVEKFNDGLSKYENDEYLSKKHLLDYVDGFLSELMKKYDIHTMEG